MGLFVMGFVGGMVTSVFVLALCQAAAPHDPETRRLEDEAQLESGKQEAFSRWEYELTWDESWPDDE